MLNYIIPKRIVKIPKVSKKELLQSFERMCKVFGVVSAGFDRQAITAPIDGDKYDGKIRWAMNYEKRFGWMVVCGAGGCGACLSRYNGYMQTRWNFLMMIEAVTNAAGKIERMYRT